MKLLPKFLVLFFILLLCLLVYLFKSGFESPDVLQSSTSTSFGNFTVVTIDQYPRISYSDSYNDTMETRFSTIRKYSQPTKFTHHLCNNVNESSTAWKKGDTCTDYVNPNPKFIKLNFDQGYKLVLFSHYGIYSVDSENNKIKWQSTHVDRFLNNDITKCKFKYDPSSVIPVKSNNKYYLYSTFNGLNTKTCLQFYDESIDSKSFSSAGRRLLLSYEVSSNGELNRDYSRNGARYELVSGIPFGPGPKNSTSYANNPLDEVIGCGKFDSSNNCTISKGVVKNYETKFNGKPVYGDCLEEKKEWVAGYVRCATCKTEYTYPYGTGGYDRTTWVCANQIGANPSCGPNKNPGTTKTVGSWADGQWKYTMSGTDAKRAEWLDYEKTTCIKREVLGVTGAYFSASMSYPIFSNFINYSLNQKDWNIKTSSDTPSDYQIYQQELDRDSSIDAPLNFTSEINKSVFLTNNFLFKVNRNGNSVSLDRYKINSNEYNLGGSSYIIKSSKLTKSVGSSSHSNFSIDYYKNDIFIMISGSTGFDFFRIKNINNTDSNFGVTDLTSEISNKISSISYGRPKSFGIIENKIFIVTNQSVLVSEIVDTTEDPPIVTDLGYKNFEFNGNVYSRENLISGFMFSPVSERFKGNYLTPNNVDYSIKSFKNTLLSFNYLSPLPLTLKNYSNFNGSNFSRFNLFFEDVNISESVPLQNSQYLTLNPNSSNNFEIINISKGKGIKIDLNNTNIVKNFDKYVLINMDKNNRSRINFYVDCSDTSYSLICSGVKFNFKGALLGQFYISGKANTLINNTRFIRIHENADVLINLANEVRSKKYQTVSSTIVNLNYE